MTTLSDLGLSRTDERVYRHLLRHSGVGAQAVAAATGLPVTSVSRSLDQLVAKGVLVRVAPGLHDVETPSVGLARLTEARTEELRRQIQQLSGVGDLARELQSLRDPHETHDYITEHLASVDAVRERLDDLVFHARSEILALSPYSRLTADNIEHSKPLNLRCVRRGISVRQIVRRDLLDDPLSREHVLEMAAIGIDIRCARGLEENIRVFDRSVALVPAYPDDSSQGALVLHQPGWWLT